MTRARRTVGRIAFVGAGPGDPGLLTMRAAEALAGASVVITDPDVPEDVTALAAEAEIRPAVGEPAEVAKTLVTAARSGQFVVRLVAGDVLTADPVVKELQGVSRSSVLFDVIPGCRPPRSLRTPASRSARCTPSRTCGPPPTGRGWPRRPAPCCCRPRPGTWPTPPRCWLSPGWPERNRHR